MLPASLPRAHTVDRSAPGARQEDRLPPSSTQFFTVSISFFVKADGKTLEGLSRLIQSKAVKPVIEKTYSWKELAQAHRHVEAGKIGGKIGIAMR